MAAQKKIIAALREPLKAEYIRLEDEDGISGYIVSARFEGMSMLDRQELIDEAIRNAEEPLTAEEKRRVLMIAALTPREYRASGALVRVHRVRPLAGGAIEVMLRGDSSDAEYVASALRKLEGVEVGKPKSSPGVEFLMKFRAKGTEANPLTPERALAVFEDDPYIQVVQQSPAS
jgi:hypothetical protein